MENIEEMVAQAVRQHRIDRDLKPIPIPRSTLEDLLVRLYVAEGSKVVQARIAAEMQVAVYIAELERQE